MKINRGYQSFFPSKTCVCFRRHGNQADVQNSKKKKSITPWISKIIRLPFICSIQRKILFEFSVQLFPKIALFLWILHHCVNTHFPPSLLCAILEVGILKGLTFKFFFHPKVFDAILTCWTCLRSRVGGIENCSDKLLLHLNCPFACLSRGDFFITFCQNHYTHSAI